MYELSKSSGADIFEGNVYMTYRRKVCRRYDPTATTYKENREWSGTVKKVNIITLRTMDGLAMINWY